jgi:hypothetical protein
LGFKRLIRIASALTVIQTQNLLNTALESYHRTSLLGKYGMKMWIGFCWLRIWTSGVFV